jgi:hypothetical protein
VPTPVGPLGPDEIDPFDPDLWDWDAATPEPARAGRPSWIRVTAWIVLVAFGLLAVASLLR